MDSPRPRRSLLYVPGSHPRALEKARHIPADVLILDLEDGVAPDAKQEARSAILQVLREHAYGGREVVVRINRPDSPEGAEDMRELAGAMLDGIMLPKVESAPDLRKVADFWRQSGHTPPPLWANVETALGILNASSIAAAGECVALVAGTNDLRAGLGLPHTEDRRPLHYALQTLLCAARAYGKPVFDGTYIRLNNPVGLKAECEEGKWLGFDGKTLIHPEQVEIANAVFSPTTQEIAHAQATLAAYEALAAQKRSVGLLDGQMIEELHVRRASSVLQLAAKLSTAEGET